MKPRDIFLLVVRLLGVLFLYRGIEAFPNGLGQTLQYLWKDEYLSMLAAALYTAWPLAVAWWLIGPRALQLVRMAYPEVDARTSAVP